MIEPIVHDTYQVWHSCSRDWHLAILADNFSNLFNFLKYELEFPKWKKMDSFRCRSDLHPTDKICTNTMGGSLHAGRVFVSIESLGGGGSCTEVSVTLSVTDFLLEILS